jgi:hypothetical protein
MARGFETPRPTRPGWSPRAGALGTGAPPATARRLFVIEVLGAVVSVSTKGQLAIAQSSAEAELGGAHRAALLAVGVQNTWLELFEENLPIGLLMDSAAGKIMAVRRGKGKVRHLEVKQLYLQELTNALRVKTYKAKGEENKADIGTK